MAPAEGRIIGVGHRATPVDFCVMVGCALSLLLCSAVLVMKRAAGDSRCGEKFNLIEKKLLREAFCLVRMLGCLACGSRPVAVARKIRSIDGAESFRAGMRKQAVLDSQNDFANSIVRIRSHQKMRRPRNVIKRDCRLSESTSLHC